MKLGKDGRRVDGKHLTYNDYINVRALIESLRLAPDVPQGVIPARWPKTPKGWKPGDAWPTGGNWCHDEALFITVHQGFELWCRQMRHELGDLFARVAVSTAPHGVTDIPRAHLARRDAEQAPKLDRFPKLYPETTRFAESNPSSAVRDLILHDLPAPGIFPRSEDLDPGYAPCKLAWFQNDWDHLTERIERCTKMLAVCLPYYDILLHMTPAQFLAFRDRLAPASGFGSSQFRQIEFALGVRERHFAKFTPNAPWTKALRKRFGDDVVDAAGPYRLEDSFARHCPDEEPTLGQAALGPSLRDLVYWFLTAHELTGKADRDRFRLADHIAASNLAQLDHDNDTPNKMVSAVVTNDTYRQLGRHLAHFETVAVTALLESTATPSGLARLLQACLALDDGVLHWRDVHLRFVERMIGARPGTGGGGLQYLRRVVSDKAEPYRQRGFPCLWEARSVLL
ncbi:MAG: hypothetical protein IT459_03625 [Planctomycetes bacterium]|nr:hypothetical protein [Planctomycetota bacterium]